MGPPPSAPPPSLFPPTTVQHVASTSLGLPALKDNVASALAADTEHRLRLILQDAEKFMRHGKRSMLTADDVKRSLELKGMEPVYGFLPPAYSSAAYLRQPHFRRTMTSTGVVYHVEDTEIDLDAVAEIVSSRSAAAAALASRKGGGGGGVGWKAHWLAIEGVQPLIPENPPPYELARAHDVEQRGKNNADANGLLSATAAASSTSGAVAPAPGAAGPSSAAATDAAKQGAGASASASASTVNAQSRPLVKHILSRELQVYYRRLTEAIVHGIATASPDTGATGTTDAQGDSSMREQDDGPAAAATASTSVSDGDALDPTSLAALSSLRADPGLHQLVPYLCQWISTNISAALALSPSPPSSSSASASHSASASPAETSKRRRVVSRMVSSIEAMVLNPDLGIEGYVHLLLPPLLSVVLVSLPPKAYPTTLRHKAAALLAHILRRFAPMYPSLKPRITRVLLEAAFMGVSASGSAGGGGGGGGGEQAQPQDEDQALDMPQPSCSTKLGAVIALRYCGGGMTRALVRARAPARAKRARSSSAAAGAVGGGGAGAGAGAGEEHTQAQEPEQAQTREEPDLDEGTSISMDEDVAAAPAQPQAQRFAFEPKLKALGGWLSARRRTRAEGAPAPKDEVGGGGEDKEPEELTDLVREVRLCLLDIARSSPSSSSSSAGASRPGKDAAAGKAGEAETETETETEERTVAVSDEEVRGLVGTFWSERLGLGLGSAGGGTGGGEGEEGEEGEVRRGLLVGLGLA